MVYRIDNSEAATTLPTARAVGTPGFFTRGNPSTGTPATIVDDDWLNMVQEELAAVVAGAGIALAKGSNAQLLAALQVLFGGTGSLAAAGYMHLPGGLMAQWNSGDTVTGNNDPVSFPISFPNGCLAIVVNEASAIGWVGPPPNPTIYGASSRTASGFDIYAVRVYGSGSANVYAGICNYSYIALGH